MIEYIECFNVIISRHLFFRLKQATRPATGFDYRVISTLNTTLRELYIVGVRNLSTSLSSLTKLHTLSLG